MRRCLPRPVSQAAVDRRHSPSCSMSSATCSRNTARCSLEKVRLVSNAFLASDKALSISSFVALVKSILLCSPFAGLIALKVVVPLRLSFPAIRCIPLMVTICTAHQEASNHTFLIFFPVIAPILRATMHEAGCTRGIRLLFLCW